MELGEWARGLAQDILGDELPRRWAHTAGVASKAMRLAPILGANAELIEAACWLHDIGYAAPLHDTGFHPLDGARYLRDVAGVDPLLCRLVANHSCALIEATERGLGKDLAREFAPAPLHLGDALTYCDMTTGPDGRDLTVRRRIAEILKRYGPEHVVSRSILQSAPELIAAVDRVQSKLVMVAPRRLTSQLELAMAAALS
jgi:HD domain